MAGMTYRADKFRRGAIDVHQQGTFVERCWPGFEYSIASGRLTCRGPLRPSSCSPIYQVRLTYRVNDSPRVYIDEPPLERRPEAPDEPIPHTFQEHRPGQERPCLYFDEWHPSKYFAYTIIPWTSEWLSHYELWRMTGVWTGGGVPHRGGK